MSQTALNGINTLEKSDWHKLVNGIRQMIADNPGITLLEIENSVTENNPGYTTKLITQATNTAKSFHQACQEYLVAMQPLNYGDETLETSVLNYLTGSLQIKDTIAKAAISEGRAELKKLAFDLMSDTAKKNVFDGDVHMDATKVAKRIKNNVFRGELTDNLFSMLVVAVAAQQNILREKRMEQDRENQRLAEEKNTAEAIARKEKATADAEAKKIADEAKIAARAKKEAEKAQKIQNILSRPRVKFAMAGRIFYAFNVNQEEAFLLDDGAFCITGEKLFKVNKNPKSGRTSTTDLVGAELVVDVKEMNSNTDESTAAPVAFNLEKAQTIWVVYMDQSGQQQTVKAAIIPANHADNMTIADDDNGLLFVNDANGGLLYRKTASVCFCIATCRPATRDEKTAVKGQKMSKAA